MMTWRDTLIPRPSPGTGRGRRLLRPAGAVLAAAALVALAACGTNSAASSSPAASSSQPGGGTSSAPAPSGASSSGSSSSSSSGSSSAAGGQVVSAAELATLQAKVTAAEAVPQFTPTGPAFDASAAKGDKFLVMPSNTGIAYCADIASGVVALGSKMGIAVTNIATEGTVSQWTTGTLQGVTAGVQAEGLICGIPPGVVAPQLQLAKEHNISVVFDQSYDLGAPASYQKQEIAPAGIYQTGVAESQAARITVDQSIVNNGGKPFDTLILTSSDIFISPGIVAATENELQTVCGSACGYTVQNIPIADWATRTQSTVASALAANPNIKAVQVLFAGMTVTGGLAAVEAAHRPGLKIYEWGAGNGDMQQIAGANGIIAGDIGCGSDWTYYNLMDQMLRVVTHQQAINATTEACKTRLFTPANASQYFTGDGWGNSYVAGYEKQWELSS
jgi:ribose transport system substrate-binding protein